MARGVHHHNDHEPESEGDAHRSERAVALRVGDDRPAAREDQRERGEPFGSRASWQIGAHVWHERDSKD